ncbi:Signal transduction histidine-protein kinase BarA [BD1-7 clade bacterium]|uniref:histidine kinase n=1 Tax=BD1-7 clade bacterium TaxID=2029982 RepID=A0A5S9P9U6_9GAMM|nr:Signal transduction histidine-protein kinase BarA [BD1-7 clade bacterium]CAA0115925.1 Signal transduction histidine-protein kinase BarA [BD1-7 clade bacterium]
MLKGLRLQILTLAVLPSVLVSLAAGIYLNYANIRNIDAFVYERGKATAAQVANIARVEILNDQINVLQSIANTSLEEKGLRSISIFNTHGRLLAHAGPRLPPFKKLLAWHETNIIAHHNNDNLGFLYPIERQEYTSNLGQTVNGTPSVSRIGWVAIEYNTSDFTVHRYNTSMQLYSILLLALAFSILIGYRFSKRIHKDVDNLSINIQRLRQEDPVVGDDDFSIGDFQRLADSLNELSHMRQQEYNDLRHSVELTTSDLQETIEAIEIQNIELSIAQKEALKASKIKSEFLANTSHEIRTPLNGIIGFTKILQRTTMSPQQQEYLETIQVSSEGLLTIINDILDFSKIEAGKLELERAPFNLRQILEEVVSLFAPAAYEKHLEITLMIYQDVPVYLISDPTRIKQIFSNLISNAIKFTDSGEVVVRVELENQDNSSGDVALHATISDTGIGMDKTQCSELFQAFSQGNRSISREYGGTGLGLAIVKSLTEMLGGTISATSQKHVGTSFNLNLKLRLQRQPPVSNLRLLEGKSVVILEPHKPSNRAICGLLQSWQVHAHCATTEAELQECLDCFHADAILYSFTPDTDIQDARETIERLEEQYHTRVAALTPISLTQISCFHDANLAYCSKPVSEHVLYRTLARLIRPELSDNNSIQQPKPLTGTSFRALAVDDNAANLKLLTVLLHDLNVEADTADNGEKALAATQAKDFDIIFMDVQMPVMNGLDASKAIREHTDTPIIALTAHALADEKDKLLAAGVNAYLTKPVQEAQIRDAIREYCQTNNDQKQNAAVDVQACLKLANNKADLAADMFQMLVERLPADINDIQQHVKSRDYDMVLTHVHKLHGACCYTGVVLLKSACYEFEKALKEERYSNTLGYCETLEREAEAVLAWSQTYSLGNELNKLL